MQFLSNDFVQLILIVERIAVSFFIFLWRAGR